MRREQRHRRHERIGQQERFDGEGEANGLAGLRAEGSTERGVEQEVHEEREEPGLCDATHPDEPANRRACGNAGPGKLPLLEFLLEFLNNDVKVAPSLSVVARSVSDDQFSGERPLDPLASSIYHHIPQQQVR